ncbi:hypothetical protein AZE42_07981 [Rhizopogon vesiculosus]|uniref:Major facilitator superfamily (MFS) profile domain-containing protein n=1 Tax=Rhizopogon vesiculosus TaxID=180088 RepID=A0A1J8Q5H9_9AGAM|nr:hypothetical protein AZE42_07981 [Rhizopogon vesiculosus]
MQAYSPALPIGTQRHYKSSFDALATIWRTEGIRGYVRGMDAAILRTAMGSSVQLPTYNWTKNQLVGRGILPGDSVWTFLASSSVSGICVCLVMQPADTALTRMYNQPTTKLPDGRIVGALYKSPIDCLWKTVQTEGILGWYKGSLAHFLRITPHTIVTLTMNDVIRNIYKNLAWGPSMGDLTLHGSSLSPDSLKEVDQFDGQEMSAAEKARLERIVWRKLDRWVLPIATIFYLLSFLDRSNIANARVAGMQTSLKMSNYQYSIALTMTYVPYIVAEFPSNLLLKASIILRLNLSRLMITPKQYVGPRWMLPTMVTIWGLVATMQANSAAPGVVKTYSGLLACRFFLGLMEGGLFPGLVLYLSFFYPRERLQIRVATFFASASLSGAFSGLLAAAITNINGKGGRPGWAWIFILEGIFTFLFGLICFFILPNSAATATFFSTKERDYVLARLKEDGAISSDDKSDSFSWIEVFRCFKSLHVLMLAPVLFVLGVTLYGLAYFEPTIVAGLGYTGNKAQLMSAPPFVVAFVVSMITAVIADRYNCRGFMIIFFMFCNVIGFAMFYASKSNHIRYGSLFLTITGCYCSAPPAITWVTNNSAPHVRRATSVAIAFILTNAGGILSTWLMGSLSPAPNYTKATITNLIMSIAACVLACVNLAYLWRQNRLKAERRQLMTQADEPEGMGDESAWFVYKL